MIHGRLQEHTWFNAFFLLVCWLHGSFPLCVLVCFKIWYPGVWKVHGGDGAGFQQTPKYPRPLPAEKFKNNKRKVKYNSYAKKIFSWSRVSATNSYDKTCNATVTRRYSHKAFVLQYQAFNMESTGTPLHTAYQPHTKQIVNIIVVCRMIFTNATNP